MDHAWKPEISTQYLEKVTEEGCQKKGDRFAKEDRDQGFQ